MSWSDKNSKSSRNKFIGIPLKKDSLEFGSQSFHFLFLEITTFH